jgi:flagellar biosynthesis/type III secretory pathway protein FliH
LYDQREKARRDYEGAIDGATQRGIEIGLERGEKIGLKKGNLIGTIRTLQELLGDPVASDEELREKPIETLQAHADELKKRLADRLADRPA